MNRKLKNVSTVYFTVRRPQHNVVWPVPERTPFPKLPECNYDYMLEIEEPN